MSDQYKTVIGLAESNLKVKKSRFIGLAAAIQSQDAIKDFLRLVQQKYPNASHYCYAYKIEAGSGIRDYATDAGEPTHSAGPPILSAIKTAELSNVICVIVRYYGGLISEWEDSSVLTEAALVVAWRVPRSKYGFSTRRYDCACFTIRSDQSSTCVADSGETS